MAAPVYALASKAEFKEYFTVGGTAKDTLIDRILGRASLAIEGYLDRRVVYRAPSEVDGAANILASRALADETIASGSLAAQPNSAGRTLIVTITDTDGSVTAGTVTVTGTVNGVAGTTEVFDIANGLVQHGVKFFTAISSIVNAATGEAASDTIKIGSSLGYVEYHTLEPAGAVIPQTGTGLYVGPSVLDGERLYALERPFQQVLEVNEDTSRAYAASTKLVVDTDHLVSRHSGLLTRLSGGLPSSWARGYRAEKLVYSAGYFGTANVPPDIKDVALRLAATIYKESDRQQFGQVGGADAAGNYTRFGPAVLDRSMREQLARHRRAELYVTGARDFDLEAA